jgi:hypothetical protein
MEKVLSHPNPDFKKIILQMRKDIPMTNKELSEVSVSPGKQIYIDEFLRPPPSPPPNEIPVINDSHRKEPQNEIPSLTGGQYMKWFETYSQEGFYGDDIDDSGDDSDSGEHSFSRSESRSCNFRDEYRSIHDSDWV